MRQYRAMPIDGKDFVYGWYAECEGKSLIIQSDQGEKKEGRFNLLDFEIVIPETVGQCAGLKDKNDKDLDWWEGDIFRFAGSVMPRTLCFFQGRFIFRLGKPPNDIECACKSVLGWGELPIKIGTVHTHSELLEK